MHKTRALVTTREPRLVKSSLEMPSPDSAARSPRSKDFASSGSAQNTLQFGDAAAASRFHKTRASCLDCHYGSLKYWRQHGFSLSNDLTKVIRSAAPGCTPIHAAAKQFSWLTLGPTAFYDVSGWFIALYIYGRMLIVTRDDDAGQLASHPLILLGIHQPQARFAQTFAQTTKKPAKHFKAGTSFYET